jgi:DNA-binding NarL/FixJ family response regulator
MPHSAPDRNPITLAIVEDDHTTRETLVALLASEHRFRCIGAYASAEEAIASLPQNPPDVALVDINLPKMSGIECVARLKALIPKLQILMLTTYEDSDKIVRSLRVGADGYLLKKLIDVDLLNAIEQVRAGGAPMSAPVARKVVAYFHGASRTSTSALDQLTPRELEILELLSTGCLYKQIGDRLGISFSTVRAHLRNIYEKLHVQSRTEATVKFLQRD